MNKRVICALMSVIVLFTSTPLMKAYATTVTEAKKEKQEAENKLSNANSKVSNLEKEKEEVEEEAEELNEELVELLSTVEIIKGDIENKEEEIRVATEELEQATKDLENQRNAMMMRIKFMYEKGDATYLDMYLKSGSISEAVNKADYVEKLYEYDRRLLYQFQDAKANVEIKKAELENDMVELKELEADLQEQQASLEEKIAELQETMEDFDAQLANARAEASRLKKEVSDKTSKIRALEAEEKKKAEEEAKKKALEEAKKKAEEEAKKKSEEKAASKVVAEGSEGDGTVKMESVSEEEIEKEKAEKEKKEQEEAEKKEEEERKKREEEDNKASSSGSAKGREIANYACNFIGNPYVSGGTSLTEGADCSGFTQAVYDHFGISIPRTSGSQASIGKEVDYVNAAPGDIIYYGGHVAIYIGNGQIVHASTPATGIKISNALYRTIITVRRVV